MNCENEAIAIWEKGVLKERAGAMTDAIKFYREALRVEPNIEKLYRKKLQEEWELSEKLRQLELAGLQEKIHDSEAYEERKNEDSVQEGQNAVEIAPCWILDMLPDDILSNIIKELVLTSSESWVNLSLSCKKFNELCFHDSVPYRTFSKYIYQRQRYDEGEMQLNGISNIQTMEESIWGQNFKRMLEERPYIKFQGVYISVVNYLRYGSIQEGSSSLINPIHMITYYRYFRFYPDGTCLRLLTTDEPSTVVKDFCIENQPKIKESDLCKWFLSLDAGLGHLVIKRQRTKDQLDFCEELQITNQGQKRYNKLKWIQSTAVKTDGSVMQFSLKKEKPFIFSRVRSFEDD